MTTTTNTLFRVALALGLIAGLFACQKETEPDGPASGPAPITSELFGSATTVNVAGVVLDEAGEPVQGATVMAGFGSQTTTTDEHGVFRLDTISGYTGLGLVRVSKSGYFPGSRSFLPSGTLNTVRIVLLTRTQVGTVNAASGGQVQAQGATVTFASGGFVRNGAAYTGSVNVYMDRLDPAAPDFVDRMPGDLVAVQDNAPRMLVSYGMVAVELTDVLGQAVELAPGTTAEVRFPITATQQGSAPAQIDLWWYDEEAGYWQHEGTATRQGNEYVGQVSHFSFWNCDVPADLVELRGDVYSSGGPLSGAIVTVTSPSLGSATDYTGPTGSFGGYVPAGEPLTLTVSLVCPDGTYQVVHTQQLGVLTVNTNVGLVVVNNSNITLVSGSVVGCNGQPVAQGYVLANGEAEFTNGGLFSFSTCLGGSITLTGIDPVGGASSAAVTISLVGSVVDAGQLEACAQSGGDSHLNPNLTYGSVTDIEGNEYATIVIGTQEWMAENLRTTRYSNGQAIPYANWNQWGSLNTGAWAYYDDDSQYAYPFGKLYNWYAVADPRNVCPTGWHVPTDAEWDTLVGYLDPSFVPGPIDIQSSTAGGKMKSIGTQYWNSPNTGATNESGFSGLPGDCRSFFATPCNGIGQTGKWWSVSTSNWNADYAWYRVLQVPNSSVFRYNALKRNGFSVRCIRD